MFHTPSTELPWPDDMIVAGTEIMLVPNDAGELIGERAQNLDNVVPTAYDVSSYPLHAERPYPLHRFFGGMGLKRQLEGPPIQYYYGEFIDASIGGMVGKGPHFRSQNGLGGSGWAHAQGLDGGTLKEFSAFGQYVGIRNGDGAGDWALSFDFGVGRTVMSLVRFKNRGGTVTDSVYAALDNGELWQYNGAIWTLCVLPAGFLPVALEVRDEDIFAFGGNELRSATANPTLAANWSGPVYVGEPSSSATGLRALHGQLFPFKEDGVFAVSGIGATLEVTDLLPELRGQRAATNGRTAWAWNDALWFRFGDTLWKLTTSGDVATAKAVGLSVLMFNDSEVRGTPIGFAGQQNWFGYFVVVNGLDSYLCKWGEWLNPTEADPGNYRFSEVPHGALFKWTGKQATGLWVSNVMGATENERLYVKFSDGSIEWCKLPKGTPNPFASGSGAEFTLSPGLVYFPEITAGFETQNKNWRSVITLAPIIDAADTVQFFYKLDSPSAWVELPEQFTATAQRVDFPSNLGSKSIFQYARLNNATIVTSPLVEGWYLMHSVVPETILEYTGAADARHYRARRDGTVDTRSPSIIRQAILDAVGAIGAVTCTMPDSAEKELNFFRYTEEMPSKWKRFGLEWLVPFKAIEFHTSIQYGTHRRLMQYTHAQLGVYTHAQLQTL